MPKTFLEQYISALIYISYTFNKKPSSLEWILPMHIEASNKYTDQQYPKLYYSILISLSEFRLKANEVWSSMWWRQIYQNFPLLCGFKNIFPRTGGEDTTSLILQDMYRGHDYSRIIILESGPLNLNCHQRY